MFMFMEPKVGVSHFSKIEKDHELMSLFVVFHLKRRNPPGLAIPPHLRRYPPQRIANYSDATAALNLRQARQSPTLGGFKAFANVHFFIMSRYDY